MLPTVKEIMDEIERRANALQDRLEGRNLDSNTRLELSSRFVSLYDLYWHIKTIILKEPCCENSGADKRSHGSTG